MKGNNRNFREMPQSDRKHRINEDIRAKQVRIVGDDEDKKIGVISTREALNIARERGVDLVQVGNDENPCTCKLMDYGKFIFHTKKKTKHQELASRAQEDREIRLRPASADHDLEVKAKKAREFIKQGCKVHLQIKLRGREKYIENVQEDIANRFSVLLSDVARLEKAGNSFTLIPT